MLLKIDPCKVLQLPGVKKNNQAIENNGHNTHKTIENRDNEQHVIRRVGEICPITGNSLKKQEVYFRDIDF